MPGNSRTSATLFSPAGAVKKARLGCRPPKSDLELAEASVRRRADKHELRDSCESHGVPLLGYGTDANAGDLVLSRCVAYPAARARPAISPLSRSGRADHVPGVWGSSDLRDQSRVGMMTCSAFRGEPCRPRTSLLRHSARH